MSKNKNQAIIASSKVFVITAVNKVTKAAFYKDLRVGDKLVFSMQLTSPGYGSRGHLYVPQAKVENIKTGTYTNTGITQIQVRMSVFDYEEVIQ